MELKQSVARFYINGAPATPHFISYERNHEIKTAISH